MTYYTIPFNPKTYFGINLNCFVFVYDKQNYPQHFSRVNIFVKKFGPS